VPAVLVRAHWPFALRMRCMLRKVLCKLRRVRSCASNIKAELVRGLGKGMHVTYFFLWGWSITGGVVLLSVHPWRAILEEWWDCGCTLPGMEIFSLVFLL